MKRDYRADRANVTHEIEACLYNLIVVEADTFKKKKHTAGWYRLRVAEELNLPESKNPSLRTYQNKVQEIRNKLQSKSPEDEPCPCIPASVPLACFCAAP